MSVLATAGPLKAKKKRKRDEMLPVIDPLLEPFGDAAEEEMRKKLKRRLKELRKTKKEEKRAKRTAKRDKEAASGYANVVKVAKKKKREKIAEADGFRLDRHEENHRVNPDEVLDRRYFPYKKVFYDDRPGPSNHQIPPRLSSRVVPVCPSGGGRSGGVEAERWDHGGFEASREDGRRPPPPLPPDYYRGQKPGQRRGLGSYAPRTCEEEFPPRGQVRNQTSFPPRNDFPSRPGRGGFGGGGTGANTEPLGGPSYTDYRYGNRGPEDRPPMAGRPELSGRGRGGGWGSDERRKRFPRSRSPSPGAPSGPVAGQPMPDHIKWLHDRWSKYDSEFFQGSKATTIPDPLAKRKTDVGQQNDLAEFRKRKRGRKGKEPDPEPTRLSRNHMPFYVHHEMRFGRIKTFKEFLMGHHEDIQNQERATQLYNEYKLQFRQRAFAEFFQEHSEDEWFLEKYHPVVKAGRDARRRIGIQRRLDVFMQLLVRGWLEVSLDAAESRKTRRLLDAAIVLMEGGDEADMACLSDLDYILEEKKEETYKVQDDADGPLCSDSEEEDTGKAPGALRTEDERAEAPTEEQLEIAQHAKDYSFYIQCACCSLRDTLSRSEQHPPVVGPSAHGARHSAASAADSALRRFSAGMAAAPSALLSVGSVNLNSLTSKRDELAAALCEIDADACLIQETKLNSKVPRIDFEIPGFFFVRLDRNRNGGGVGIFVKDCWSCIPVGERVVGLECVRSVEDKDKETE